MEIAEKHFGLSFDKCEQCCRSLTCPSSETQFLKSVTIWINKPHVVNRRLCGSRILGYFHFDEADHSDLMMTVSNHLSRIKSESQIQEVKGGRDLSQESSKFTVMIRELIPKSEHFPSLLEVIIFDKEETKVTFLPCRRSLKEEDAGKLKCEEIAYSIQLSSPLDDADLSSSTEKNEISLSWQCDHSQEVKPRQQLTSNWLHSILLKKLVSWAHVKDVSTAPTSLKLVTVDRYKDVYVQLKNKYGKDLVKRWTERTDPKKYVYEDIAIASYLMLIWEEERNVKKLTKKQTFVDLGCGNGLLVYILSREGYKGLGIDLKKRKIWDTYGEDTDLKEQSIEPSADSLFPEYDWIIGNHSDELTPWIPVIAARSSYKCNFFLLPCCHHDFVGKYAQTEKGKSQYASYMGYIGSVVEMCGFKVEQDTLRIPSTKRICYIGRHRSYEMKDEALVDSKRRDFIAKQIARHKSHQKSNDQLGSSASAYSSLESNEVHLLETEKLYSTNANASDEGYSSMESTKSFISETNSSNSPEVSSFNDKTLAKRQRQCNSYGFDLGYGEEKRPRLSTTDVLKYPTDEPKQTWTSEFQVRKEQTNKNCQSVSEDVKMKFVERVFQKVMSSKPSTDPMSVAREWFKGGVVPLSEAAELFDKSDLRKLKSECGGLQTLLRNHSHIFQVTQGKIQLRDFTKVNPWEGRDPKKARGKTTETRKTLLCWFNDHHPDGCPKDRESCLFAHGKDDLREKVRPVKT